MCRICEEFAAKNNNRNSIGIEISKEYVEIAENRINSGFF